MMNLPRTDSRLTVKRPVILIGLTGLFFLSITLWPSSTLVADFNEHLCHLPDSGFALQWQHSVEKEGWREDYTRQNSQLLLVRSRFKTYGAGTPSSGKLQTDDNGLIDYSFHRPLDELNWTVSANVQSTLWIQEQAWPVYALLDDYTTLEVRVRRLPLWRYLLMESCDEHFRQALGPR